MEVQRVEREWFLLETLRKCFHFFIKSYLFGKTREFILSIQIYPLPVRPEF